jgi:hypothetical protein
MKAPEFGAGDYNYITNQYIIYNMISIDADKNKKNKNQFINLGVCIYLIFITNKAHFLLTVPRKKKKKLQVR